MNIKCICQRPARQGHSGWHPFPKGTPMEREKRPFKQNY
jgi:hypothetical protein